MEIKTSAPRMTGPMHIIGFGKSVTNSVVFGDTYGKPGNTKVSWDYEVRELINSNSYYDRTDTFRAKKLISISSGKVTVSSKVYHEWLGASGEYVLVLKAYAMDGSGTVATKEFLLIRPATTMKMIEWNKVTMPKESSDWMHFACDQMVAFGNQANAGFTATSSNPDIVGVREVSGAAIHECSHWSSNGALKYYDIYFVTGSKKGTATITIKANDGSGKSCKFTVTVK
jgi:hypothetical protein